ncbi:B-cell antigen receptor complex-associated protein alpha chain [Brachionichthys hirsutus]|uniref:B-cell antigen receptor complex-associated protein alpha chain n=1 Tax=Brachionichthys hirsutus TaxID=412623 RepID=UPI003604F7BA
MWTVIKFLLCSLAVVEAQHEVNLKADRPYVRVRLGDSAALDCCYATNLSLESIWVIRAQDVNVIRVPESVNASDLVTIGDRRESDTLCGTLSFKSVQLNDSGLYQCFLKSNEVHLFTHGTYMQVYKPLGKTINLSEKTKNRILAAEGILLLLFVLLPAASLLYQSKKLTELKRKKFTKEEENIYQGLNLDDCGSAYDPIERSQGRSQYQDVCAVAEEEEEIDLEKP